MFGGCVAVVLILLFGYNGLFYLLIVLLVTLFDDCVLGLIVAFAFSLFTLDFGLFGYLVLVGLCFDLFVCFVLSGDCLVLGVLLVYLLVC